MFTDDLEILSSHEKTWFGEVLEDFEKVHSKNQEYLDFLKPYQDEIEKYFTIQSIEHKEIL